MIPLDRPNQLGLNARKRHDDWQTMYPEQSFRWNDWHMNILDHGPMRGPQHDKSIMSGLYQTNTWKTEATQVLFNFEVTTVFDRLPRSTHMTGDLRRHLGQLLFSRGINLWGNLPVHYQKHATPEELPTMNRVCAVLRAQAKTLGLTEEVRLTFFPAAISSQEDYGRLAIAVFIIAALERSIPFPMYLYVSRPPDNYTLGLTLEVPLTYLRHHGVEDEWNILTVGFTLAQPRWVDGKNGPLALPHLLPEFRIATVYVADAPLISRQQNMGQLCPIHLS